MMVLMTLFIMVMVMMVLVAFLIMVMMVVFMVSYILGDFFFSPDADGHVRATDAALFRRLRGDLHIGEKVVHLLQEGCLLRFVQQLIERGCQHITGSTHVAFQIQCFHMRLPFKMDSLHENVSRETFL